MNYCYHCMNPLSEGCAFCPTCGKSSAAEFPMHHLKPGTVLNNRFLIGAALGEGGFGITYIGRDLMLDMRIAVKEYFPNGYVNRTNTVSSSISIVSTEERRDFFNKGKDRFLKEARILAKFSTEPGIVCVRDFFEVNNTAYIVMEYLDGITLKEHLRQNGNLSPEQTLQLLSPVMNSLKKIHESGLIHRDISPDNIMLLKGGGVKLLDFGAARNVTGNENCSFSIILKPGYAPEEQYRSRGNQGPWTDVYALCATIYRCITGVTPDDSPDRIHHDELKPPSALGIRVSPAFEGTLMRGMAVLQENRFQSIDTLLNAFHNPPVVQNSFVQNQTVIRNQTVVGNGTPVFANRPPVAPPNGNNAYNNWAPPPQKPKKKKKIWLIIVIAVVVIGLIGYGIAYLTNDRSESSDSPATSSDSPTTSSGSPATSSDSPATSFDSPSASSEIVGDWVYEAPDGVIDLQFKNNDTYEMLISYDSESEVLQGFYEVNGDSIILYDESGEETDNLYYELNGDTLMIGEIGEGIVFTRQ